jgi:hypothetical protein
MSRLTYRQRLRQKAARAEHNGNPFVWGEKFKNTIEANDYGTRPTGLKRKYYGGIW